MINIMLPIISENLNSKENLIVECGILSLGIISNQSQTSEKLKKFLKENLNFLLNQMKNEVSIIKTTTMWTLGKYSSYISSSTSNEICSKYILNILNLIKSNDVQVQQAALNSYLSLIEISESNLLDISFNEDEQQHLFNMFNGGGGGGGGGDDGVGSNGVENDQQERDEIHHHQQFAHQQQSLPHIVGIQGQQGGIGGVGGAGGMRIVEKIPITSPISQNFKLIISTFTKCLNSSSSSDTIPTTIPIPTTTFI